VLNAQRRMESSGEIMLHALLSHPTHRFASNPDVQHEDASAAAASTPPRS